MPIYAYACPRCEERFEELVSSAASDGVACPRCGSQEVERLLSAFSTRWKPSFVNWHRVG